MKKSVAVTREEGTFSQEENLPKEEMSRQNLRTRCEVYSRVVGFLTPVSQWNKGKLEEFKDRKPFRITS